METKNIKTSINIGDYFRVPVVEETFVVLDIVPEDYFMCKTHSFFYMPHRELSFKINFDDIESYEGNTTAIREMKLNYTKILEIQKAILEEEIRFVEKEIIEIQILKLNSLKVKLKQLEKE